jgi:hypothetical protein
MHQKLQVRFNGILYRVRQKNLTDFKSRYNENRQVFFAAPCTVHIVCLLHISANPVAILRDAHYEGYVTKAFEQMHQ